MKRRRGSILVSVMAIVLALSIMVGAFHIYMFNRIEMYIHRVNTIKAYYIAYAGIELGRMLHTGYWLTYVPDWSYDGTFAVTSSGDNITIKLTPDSNIMKMTSTAKYNGVERTLTSNEECDLIIKRFDRIIYSNYLPASALLNQYNNPYNGKKQETRIEWPVVE